MYNYAISCILELDETGYLDGNSKADLVAFPEEVRREIGYQLEHVQEGMDPDDWKPMPTVGAGVREIRVRESS